jgi:hypothetical protein
LARKDAIDVVKNVFSNADDAAAFGKVVDDALKTGGKGGKGGTIATPGAEDIAKVKDLSAFGSKGGMDQAKKFGSAFYGNLQRAASSDGHGSVLGMVGNHAIKGAAWGAVGGGTIEAAQGGSFWDGAKQGAFNGAVGFAGARAIKRGVGADSYLFGKDSVVNAGTNLFRAFSKDKDISGQAVAILNNRQVTGVAQSVMNQRKAAAKG